MSPYLSPFSRKSPARAVRRKHSRRKDSQASLDLMQLEPRLVMAPNVLAPETTAANPFGFPAGTLNLSGALAVSLLDTPTPASTAPFQVTVASSAGTASVGSPANVTVMGDGTNSLQIQGSLADINAALGGLVYTNATATGSNATITVTARDSAGTPLSDSRVIYVRVANSTTAPTITSALADISYTAETAATPVARATIPVVVTDPQGTTGLVVTTTNDNPALINGITVAGTTPNFTLAITTKTGITGTAVVAVKVSDGTNFTTKSFKVTVTPNPYTLAALTLAGRTSSTGPKGYVDGTGAAATFTNPRGSIADANGFIYVQDNNLIRRINATTREVVTLAGATTRTTSVDGVGSAAGIIAIGSTGTSCMGISVDNKYLYFLGNAGTNSAQSSLRRLVIDTADPDFGRVTTLISTGLSGQTYGRLVPSADGRYLFLNDYNPGKITRIDLQTNTFATFAITYNGSSLGTTYSLHATSFIQGPSNTALILSHSGIGTPSDFQQAYISVNLSTGVVTKLGTYTGGSTANSASTYNPVTNEVLVNRGSQLTFLDATNGTVKYTAPGGGSASTQYLDGTSGTVNPQDALTTFNGEYYTSDWNGTNSDGNTAHIRAIKVAPGLFNPGSVTFTEGQTNYFDNAALEKMAVVANGSTSIVYTLTALNGTLDVSSVTGLTGVTGRGTKSLSFTGNEADINAALATLTYTPDTGFINASTTGTAISGTPLETVTTTATGSDANGSRGTNTATTSVLVKALNNAPRILTTLANQNYVAASTQVTEPVINFTIADADTAASSFTNNATTGARITVTSSNPNLFLPASMATAIGGSNNARTLTLKHEAGITGSATITITINDGTNQNTYTFRVTVTPSPYIFDVSTLAGRPDGNASTGYMDGTGYGATFTNPRGATADNRGLVYVQDGNVIRSISNSGVVTTLAGTPTATTSRVDGVGAAATIANFNTNNYSGMKVSPDNDWLFFINGGWMRKMGINPSDTANYRKVTSVVALPTTPFPTTSQPLKVGGGLVFSSDGNTIFLVPDGQGAGVKIQKLNLLNNTFTDLVLDGVSSNTIYPVWMTQGPNNTAFLRTHPSNTLGTPVYAGKILRLDLATGMTTALAENPLNADPAGGAAVYNPLTNEILVDTNSVDPRILDANTGAVKFTLPATGTTGMYTNGVGSSFDVSDALTIIDGVYYLSQSGPSTVNRANIRAVRPAPGLYNPGTQIFTEGQANLFDNTDLEKMGVLANGSTTITYTLTALYGTLDVSSVTGLTGVTGRGTKSLSFTGSEADLNAALATLAYTPDAGFINASTAGVQITGTPLETLTATAAGSDANGARGTNSTTISVLVKAINNSPRILTPLPDRTYLVEQAVSTETAINFTIADPDTANTSFSNTATTGARITATSDNPNLILPADAATAVGGSAAARTLTLKHQANITGSATVTILISDGTNQSTYTFKVTVLPSPSYYWGILAGSAAGSQTFANGTGTAAGFSNPTAMALDPDGNLLVGDSGNMRIRKVTPQGVVTTLAGSGVNGATLSSAQSNTSNPMTTIFSGFNGIAVAPNRDIYLSDAWSNTPGNWIARIRVVRWDTATNAYKQTETLSETVPGGSVNGLLYAPDHSGLFMSQGGIIQKFTFGNPGSYTTVAGVSGTSGTTDGTGSGALFSSIQGISFDSNNDILVNQLNGAIRKVTQQGVVTTINSDLPATNSYSTVLPLPGGAYLRSMSTHAVQYVANGDTATIAGSASSGTAVGLNLNATFNYVRSFVAGSNGTIYLLSQSANNIRVGTAHPTLLNPGAQSTTMGTRLAFNSADFRQLGAVSNAVDSNNNPLPITLTLSAQFGTLDLNSVAAPAGVTVTFAPGNRSVTLTGNETAIRTHLLNFGYTPDAGYLNANASGGALATGVVSPDVLSMSVTTANNTASPVTGSLNLVVRAADNSPRIITALPDKTYFVEAGVATESAISFTIVDGDTTATTFVNNASTGGRITVTSDNPNLILPADMATAIGGSGNARTVTIKHQPNITGSANVTVTISDGTNQSAYTFKVTVVPTPQYYWGILAGSPAGTSGSTNATGTSATFNAPNGMVRDSQGNLFVTDFTNQVIRRITPAGVVTTLAGTMGTSGFADGTGTAARFWNPSQIVIDADDNLYVADSANNRIRKITPAGVVTTIAGTGTASSLNGAALSATFNEPTGIAISSTGVLYVSENTGKVIRKIENGQVTTVAGLAATSALTNGFGTAARFQSPHSILMLPNGNLLIRDLTAAAFRLLNTVTTEVTTLTTGTTGFNSYAGVDADGDLYLPLTANQLSLVSSFDSVNVVGSGTAGSVLGVNTAATISDPRSMVFTPDGTVYLVSRGQNNIRVGTPYPSLRNPGNQSITEATRLAFSSTSLQQLGAFANALNTAGTATLPITLRLSVQSGTLDFNSVAAPAGVTVGGVGTSTVTLTGDETAVNTYLANFGYTPRAGYINANSSGGALASGAVSPDVLSMTVTTANNLTAPVTGSLNIVVRATDNRPRIVSALPNRTYYVEGGVATEAAITLTLGDADTAATSFVNNASTGGRINVTSDNPNLILPADMATAIGGSGNARTLTIKHQANITGEANVTVTINDGTFQNTYTFKVTVVPTPNYYWGILAGSPTGATGNANGTGTSATFNAPTGMVRDSQGNLFVTDLTNQVIRRITPAGAVTTFAGTQGTAGYADGTGTAARFSSPSQIAIDANDNLYVADGGNNRIRMINPAGVVTTVAGTGSAASVDGAAASATFNEPTGIAINPATGVLYVAERTGQVVRKIENGQVTTLAGSAGASGTTDGIGSAARFNGPSNLAFMPNGNVLVRESGSGNIRVLNPLTTQVTVLTNAAAIASYASVDAQGRLYLPLVGHQLTLMSDFDSVNLVGSGTAGSVLGVNTAATISDPRSLVFAPDGTAYLVSRGQNNIRTGTPIPSLANPGRQVVADTQLLTFSSAATQRLSIQSNGAAEPLTLTLAVTRGRVTLSQLTGLTFTAGDGTADASMTFSGSVADINAAINNLVYDFDEVANPSVTSDTLTLTAPWSAGGTTGNVVQTVPISVVKAPAITPIANVLIGVGGTITPALFTVTDADTAANALTYTITSSNTSLIPNSGLVRTGGTGATGSTAPANAQNSLAITPTANRTGSTTVTIAVSDGTLTTTRTFTVTVSPLVGAPDLVPASDTGSSSTDNRTSDNTPTFAVTLGTGVQAGDVVGIYNGSTKIGEAVVTAADITAGSVQVTTSQIADGNYSNITSSVVFGTDRGIASAALSPQLVIDSTPPAAPTGLPDLATASDTGSSGTDNVTSDTTPTFTIPLTGTGAVAGDVVELYNGATLLGTYTLIAGDITANTASLTTLGLPAGTYSDVKFRLVDAAGNASAYSGSLAPAMVIDTAAPLLMAVSPADDATRILPPSTLVMTFNEHVAKGTTGTIVIKKTSDNSTVETFNVATSARVTVAGDKVTLTPATTLEYGTGYYVIVGSTALTDEAGNAYAGLSLATDWNFTTLSMPTGVDLVAASDTGASSTDNVTSLSAIDLEVGLGAGTAVGDVIKLYDGLALVGTITVDSTMLTAGKVTFSLTGQTDGVHNYSSTLTSGGVESIATAALAVTIDTSLPSAPTLKLDPASDTGIQGDGKTRDDTPTLSGTAEPGATVELVISLNGTALSPVTVVADSNGNWTYTPSSPLTDGPYSVIASQTDLAGNTSGNSTPLLFRIDSTPPAPTAFSPADNATNISPPTSISVTFDEPIFRGSFGSITIVDDTNSVSLVIPASSSEISISGNVLTITPTTPFVSNTNYHVEIGLGVIRDANANLYAGISNATDWNFTTNNAPASPALDLQAVSDTGFSNTDNKTNLATLAFDVKVPTGAGAGDIIRVYDGQTLVRTITLLAGDVTAGTVVATLTGVTAGSHSYTSTLERISDSQVSNPSAPLVVEVSTTQPAAPVINPLGPTNDNTPTMSGTAPANSKVDLYDANNNLIGTANADANGNWSFTPTSPLPDGSYQLNAKATDAFGNTSPSSSPVNLVVDTTPPPKPVIAAVGPDTGPSASDRITSADVLTLTGTAEANSVVAIYDNGVLLGTATANGSGQWTFTTIALPDGSNSFTADATDATGNQSVASDAYTMLIDSSAPTAPVIDPLPSPNPDSTPILSGKGEPGAVVNLYDGGNPIGSAVVDANGDWTFTPSSPLSNGLHNFTADQKDTAGNTSPTSNQVSATIDSTPPAAPAITPLLGPTNDNTPTIVGTAEPNSIVKIYEGTTLLGTVTADGSGNWTFTPQTPLTDGPHDLSATATDAAGNVSPVSDTARIGVDTAAPSVAGVSPANGATEVSIDSNLVVTFSEAVALGTSGVIELRAADGTLVESFGVGSSRISLSGSTLTIDPTANLAYGGGYYVTIASGMLKDLAGNAYAGMANATDWAFTTSALPIPPAPAGLDLQAASDTGRSNTDNVTSDNTPTLDVAINPSGLNPGDIVHVYDSGVEVGTATLTAADIAAGKVSITASALADGVHSLTAKVSDANGTFSSDSAPLSVVVDTVPPVAPGVPDLAPSSDTGVSSTDDITAIKTPTFTGTGTPGDTISLYVDGVLAGTGVVDANGTYSITPASPLADGVHSITSQATDAAGLTGPLSAALSVTIDATPPATPTSPADLVSGSDTGLSSTDNITSDTTPDFTGGGLTPGHTVVLYVDGSPAGTATVDGSGNWTINASPALVDGSHTITYLVKDAAGNSSGFAPPMTVVVDTVVPAAPTALALDPASDTGLSLTDRITRDNTPTITGSGGTPGFQVTLLDASNNVIGTGLVGPDGAWSITPTSSLADGTYAFTAEYTSISGVTGPASDPLTVVIDTIAPTQPAAPTISPINPSAQPGHTNSTSPVFTGAGLTPGSLVELFVDGSTTPAGTAIVDASGNYQVISSTLTDGTHSFAVKVTDAAGNTSPASQPRSLIIDSRLPGSPTTPDLTAATDTGRSNTDNVTSDNTPDFQGVVDANSNALPGDFVEIYSGNTLVGVGMVVIDPSTGDLVWKVTVGATASGYTANTIPANTVLADGVQAISARFVTPGGTASADSQALTVSVDTTSPSAPSSAPDLVPASDSGSSSTDNLTNDTTPTFSGTGGVPGDTVNLYANGNLIGSAVVGPDGSYTVTPINPLADGSYNFTTNYVDPAGNTSPFSQPLAVVIDSTPPAVPAVPDLVASSDTGASNSDNITSDNTPTFEGFGTPGETIRIYVDGVLAGTTVVGGNGSWSITTVSLADGEHLVTSQAVDEAGNASAQSTPLAVRIDTTPPNVTSFTTPSGPTANSQPPISGTGEPGAVIRLYDGTSLVGTAIVNANGSWTITPSAPLADGGHSFTATATDGAGNTSPLSQPINVVIDTVNPLPPTVISVSQDTGDTSDRITSDNTLTITGTAEPGSVIKVLDTSSGTPVVVGTAVVQPDGSYSVTTSVLADGQHPLAIIATDAAGNDSQPTGVGTWTIDTAAPVAPTVGSVSQDTGTAGDRITSDNTLTVTGPAGSAEPGSTITVYDSSSGTPVAVGTAVVQSDGSYSVTTSVLADGLHPLAITSKDAAGNESQPTSIHGWTIDTIAPTTPRLGSVSQDTGNPTDKNTSDNTLTVTGNAGSAEPGTTITVYDSSSGTPVAVGTALVQSDGSYSVTTSVLADGVYPLSITSKDAAGNESQATGIGTWTIDTIGPAGPLFGSVSQDTGDPNDKYTSDDTLTVTGNPGSADPGSTIRLYDTSSGTPVLVGTAVVQPDGSYSVTTNALADGVYPLSIKTTDVAGNESLPTSIGTWTIDTTDAAAPSFGSVSQDTGNPTDKNTSDNTLTITGGPGSAEPGSTITVYDSSSGTPVAVGTTVVQPDGSYSVTTGVLADGVYPLSITATDAAGNESQSTSVGAWTIDTSMPGAPLVGSVSQDTGNPTDQNTSDTTLTITGGPGSADPGSTITVYDSSSGTPVAVGTAVVQSDGSYAVTTNVLADGQRPLSITAKDVAGNESPSTSIGTWTIDATAPARPTVGSVSQDTGNPSDRTTSDNTLTISGGPGSAEPGSIITVYDSSSGTPVAIGTAVVQPDGSYSVMTGVLADGAYPLSVTATDTAGNQSQPTSIGLWTIDTIGPGAPSFGSVSEDTGIPGDRITSDKTLTVTGGPGSAEPGTTITVYDTSSGTRVPVGTAVVQPDGSYAVTTSVLADGPHPLAITATDAAGNESPSTSIGTWTIISYSALTVIGGMVNELSPFAVFAVSGTPGEQFSLRLADQNADGVDLSVIEVFNGSSWSAYTAGAPVFLGASGSLLVRVAIGPERDTIADGPESFSLIATNIGNQSFGGTTSIVDDGTGGFFGADNNSAVPSTPLGVALADDRALSVTAFGPANEGSSFATFTVTATPGQPLVLSLGTTPSAVAGSANVAGFALEWSADGLNWTRGTAVPTVPGSGLVFVRTDIRSESDAVLEGSKTFTLTATYTSGMARSAAAVGTIVDNGGGSLYDGQFGNGVPVVVVGPLDDDSASLSIPDVDVNEGSRHVVFRIIASGGQVFTLGLSDGGTGFTAANDDDSARDRQRAVVGPDYLDEIAIYDGRIWNRYEAGASISIPAGGSVLLVRVPLVNDTVYEGAHAFTLTATPTIGSAAAGRAIIGDFGTGSVFNDSGAEDRLANKDDDRLLKVSSPIANEGSEHVVFKVTGITGAVELSLKDIGGGTGFAAITTPALQYWNGSAWTPYPGRPLSPGADFSTAPELLVRVAIGGEQDTLQEGAERFGLVVNGAGGPSLGVATLRDDGTGMIWLADSIAPATDAELAAAQRSLDDDTDRDGIGPTVEDALATLAASQGLASSPGDFNGDAIPDAQQSAVATVAWRDVASFEAGLAGTLTDVRPIVSVVAFANATGSDVSTSVQLESIRVVEYSDPQFGGATDAVSVDQSTGSRSIALATGGTVTTQWDPIRFAVTPPVGASELSDLYPRDGVQIRMFIDMRAAGLDAFAFNAYAKFVSAATLAAAGPAGLFDLDGNAITSEGWFDFTQRVPGGDGARFVIEDGAISGVELIITDNAFGDNDLRPNHIFDPGVPVLMLSGLAVSDVTASESSPHAMFTVTGQPRQLVSLALGNTSDPTDQDATLGVDTGNAGSGVPLQYFNGTAWTDYMPGSFVAIPSTGSTLHVRVKITNDNRFENAETFTLRATNIGGQSATGVGTIRDNGTGTIYLPTNTSGIPDAPGTPGYPSSLDDDMPLVVTATQADCAPGPQVMIVDPFTGSVRTQFDVFERRFRGGARVALGDVNADGTEEIIVTSGPGRTGEIRVYTRDGIELPAYRTQPFGPRYTGGVEAAVGDVDGDGTVDFVAVKSMGPGTTAVFRVNPSAADPVANVPYKSFVAFGRRTRAGGTVAVADLNNDGRVEVIRGSGAGATPLVNVFDLSAAPRLVDSFRPLGELARFGGGVSVSTTWFDSDATPDIVVAGGPGSGSAIQVYEGTVDARVVNQRLDAARLAAFADLASRNSAVFAAAIDVDGDGVADRIFSTQGEGGGHRGVRAVTRNGAVSDISPATRSNLRIVASLPKRVR